MAKELTNVEANALAAALIETVKLIRQVWDEAETDWRRQALLDETREKIKAIFGNLQRLNFD